MNRRSRTTQRVSAAMVKSGLVCLALLWTSSALGQVPERLHYQGYLTTSDGTPVNCPNIIVCPQTFDMVFRLYDADTGGASLWDEPHEAVGIVEGVFNVTLGIFDPLSADLLGGPRFLGVEINGQGELLPRQEVVSAAFALRSGDAKNSDSLGGLPAEDYVTVADVGQLQGPQGEPGATGATGPEGPPGPAGAPGSGGNLVHASNSTVVVASTTFTDTSIAVTITPGGTSPKILVIASVMSYIFSGSGNGFGVLRLTRNGTPLLGSQVVQHAQSPGGIDHANTMTLMFVDQPTGAGSFTYRVQARLDDGGPFTINFAGDETLSSNIIAQEF